MRIIIIGPAHPLRGGIADTNESLCRALNRRGHEATIISFSIQYPSILFPGKTQFRDTEVPSDIEILPLINSVNPLSWWNTARQINSRNPDLVIVRFWIPFLGFCLGSILRLLDRSIKVIALTDNIIPHEARAGDRFLTKYFLQPCDAFVTLSAAVLEELKTFTSKPSVYFPHPINEHLGDPVEASQARSKLKLTMDHHVVLFFGLIRKYKGVDLLIEAVGHEMLKGSGIHLIIAGEFYDDEGYYQELIEKSGLSDRVTIFKGFVPEEEIATYFSAADIVAQTYRSASQSGITPIAYHFDRPVLVTNVGGLGEMVEQGRTGYIVELDPVEIATALKDFFSNKRFGPFSQSIKVYKKKFSWDAFTRKVEDLYSSLLSL